ncbi:MAG: hypothetical protein OXL36_09620 [Bryobacterales bacterium]|nr:hypothetical protein [Bryobacterales bacterium]MDE0295429.1 hypothetical protein [Bryobacterales bacterium]
MQVDTDRTVRVGLSPRLPHSQSTSRDDFHCYNWRQLHASLKAKTLIG